MAPAPPDAQQQPEDAGSNGATAGRRRGRPKAPKPQRASLGKLPAGQVPGVTLEEAVELLQWPKVLSVPSCTASSLPQDTCCMHSSAQPFLDIRARRTETGACWKENHDECWPSFVWIMRFCSSPAPESVVCNSWWLLTADSVCNSGARGAPGRWRACHCCCGRLWPLCFSPKAECFAAKGDLAHMLCYCMPVT